MAYYGKRSATCPRCKAPAIVEEFGGATGDWLSATCSKCGIDEVETIEDVSNLIARWEAGPAPYENAEKAAQQLSTIPF